MGQGTGYNGLDRSRYVSQQDKIDKAEVESQLEAMHLKITKLKEDMNMAHLHLMD